MDRNDDRMGSESNEQNLEAARHVEENRRALEEESRRVQATAPHVNDGPSSSSGRMDGASGTGGGAGSSSNSGSTGNTGGAGMQASEDSTQARAHVREAAANRDALEEEAQRVEATKPDNVDTTGPR